MYGTDAELLSTVPAPCLAVLLCFPISEASVAHARAEQAALELEVAAATDVDGPFFVKQTVGMGARCRVGGFLAYVRH